MVVIETERLALRQLKIDDAEFILALLNEPSFLRYIGDKKVRNIEDARQYILNGPIASYAQNGFGLYLVALREPRTPIGMCGLLKREELADVDIGFAYLPDFWGQGFGYEAAKAVMNYARQTLKLQRVVAITNPDNEPSIKLLERLGFSFERFIRLAKDGDGVKLFASHG